MKNGKIIVLFSLIITLVVTVVLPIKAMAKEKSDEEILTAARSVIERTIGARAKTIALQLIGVDVQEIRKSCCCLIQVTHNVEIEE